MSKPAVSALPPPSGHTQPAAALSLPLASSDANSTPNFLPHPPAVAQQPPPPPPPLPWATATSASCSSSSSTTTTTTTATTAPDTSANSAPTKPATASAASSPSKPAASAAIATGSASTIENSPPPAAETGTLGLAIPALPSIAHPDESLSFAPPGLSSPSDCYSPEDCRVRVADPASESTTALPDLSTRRAFSKVKSSKSKDRAHNSSKEKDPKPHKHNKDGSAKPPKEKDPSASTSSSWFGFKHPKGVRSSSRLGGRSTPEPASVAPSLHPGPSSGSGFGSGSVSGSGSSPPAVPTPSSSNLAGSIHSALPPPPSIYQQSRAPESTPDLSELSLTAHDRLAPLSRQHSLSIPHSSASPSPAKVSKHARKAEKHRPRFTAPFSTSRVAKTLFEDKNSTSPFKSSLSKSTKAPSNAAATTAPDAPFDQPSNGMWPDAQDSSNSTLPLRSRSVDPYNPRALAESTHQPPQPYLHYNHNVKKAPGMPLSSSVANKDRFFSRVAGSLMSKIRNGNPKPDVEPPNIENYTYKVINLNLIEQTRKTRMSPRLLDACDKTEFWMPAFPWRCIDYLNLHGTSHVGIYRVPGSEREVQRWKMIFDTEFDVDLLQDGPDDINTVGSMFKSWLRDLPDEIFPKSIQDRIAQLNKNATEVPQMLKDELSKLPPYNYYLLFAITCHISLLHNQQAENKMDYANLCICFQPCIRLNAFCFQFLVKHWKDCWQGCWTESEYLQLEAQWDRMELQGDFSGPATFVANSPHARKTDRSGDTGFDILSNLNFGPSSHLPKSLEDPSSSEGDQVVQEDAQSSYEVLSEASKSKNHINLKNNLLRVPTIQTVGVSFPTQNTHENWFSQKDKLRAGNTDAFLSNAKSTSLAVPSISPIQPLSPMEICLPHAMS